jgi:hypothetical protein
MCSYSGKLQVSFQIVGHYERMIRRMRAIWNYVGLWAVKNLSALESAGRSGICFTVTTRSRILFPLRTDTASTSRVSSFTFAYAKAGDTPATRSRMIRIDSTSTPRDSIHSLNSRSEQLYGMLVKKSCDGIATLPFRASSLKAARYRACASLKQHCVRAHGLEPPSRRARSFHARNAQRWAWLCLGSR